MKEEYVNGEITRKLIDKGCPVRLVIKADEHIPILYELPKEHPDWQDCKAWYIPTIPQVLKWLREEKKIYIMVDRSFSVRGWHYYIIDDDDFENPIQQEVEHNRCYELAAIAGIEYALDNLI